MSLLALLIQRCRTCYEILTAPKVDRVERFVQRNGWPS